MHRNQTLGFGHNRKRLITRSKKNVVKYQVSAITTLCESITILSRTAKSGVQQLKSSEFDRTRTSIVL
jgi:hypothetical protein